MTEIHRYARGQSNDRIEKKNHFVLFRFEENGKNLSNSLKNDVERKTWSQKFQYKTMKMKLFYEYLTFYGWRFAELHSFKMVLLVLTLVSTQKICALNFILIFLSLIGLRSNRLKKFVNLSTLVFVGLYILLSMSFQLSISKEKLIDQQIFIRNCSKFIKGNSSSSFPNDTARWVGFELTKRIDSYLAVRRTNVSIDFDSIRFVLVLYFVDHRRYF